MPYVNKLDQSVSGWELAPIRKKMSIARYGADFKGCHGKTTFIHELGVYACADKDCGKYIEPTAGLKIKGTRLPLEKWADAMVMARQHGQDLSIKVAAENLGISLVTAYRLFTQINALPEFNVGIYPKRPRNEDADRRDTRRIQDGRQRRMGEQNGLMMLSLELEHLDPKLPDDLSKDYRAGLMHGLKWAAKVARQRAT